MITTKDYHRARIAWRQSLEPPINVKNFEIINNPFSVEDYEHGMFGKPGVFFGLGTYFYIIYSSKLTSNLERFSICYMKLVEHVPGTLFAALDDTSVIAFGEPCLTKYLEVVFPRGFRSVPAHETLTFHGNLDIQPEPNKKNLHATGSLYAGVLGDEAGSHQPVAVSTGLFVQPSQLAGLESSRMDAMGNFHKLAHLRVQGQGPQDPDLSLLLKHPDFVQDQPESPLLGRVWMGKVVTSQDGSSISCNVRPLETAEGPPGLFHGGGAATTWLQVLGEGLQQPWDSLRSIKLEYRRSIQLGSEVAVEWRRGKQQDGLQWWTGRVFAVEDRDKAMQTITVSFEQGDAHL